MKQLLALALLAAAAAAQQPEIPDAPQPQPRFSAAFAAGPIYNVREGDVGIAAEIDVLYRRRYAAVLGWSDMVTDNYRFRELEALGRVWLLPSLGVEAGYGWGFACYQPKPALCDRWAWRTFAPRAGPVYRQHLRGPWSALVRFDLTPTQLDGRPWSRAKDDGLRVFVLLYLEPPPAVQTPARGPD